MNKSPVAEGRVVRVKDKDFSLSVTKVEIEDAVAQMAARITADYAGLNPVMLVVLNGAFMFASDLARHLDFPCEFSFVKLKSYEGTRSVGKIRKLIGLNETLRNRNVVIVEDIVDTGLSMEFLLEELEALEPESVRIATFLFKKDAFMKDFPIDYIGIEIPNDFILGYGLDYDGYGRNLSELYTLVS